jgi:hypothetical protein
MAKQANTKSVFYFEITDTFAGEANYCWVKRLAVKARSLHGALCILSRHTGYNWKKDYDGKWNAKHNCVTCFELDSDSASYYNWQWVNC